MATLQEMLLEGERRGVLNENQASILANARERGLIRERPDFVPTGAENPFLKEEIDKMGPFQRFVIGAGKGLKGTAVGAGQLLARGGEMVGLASKDTIAAIDKIARDDEEMFRTLSEQPGISETLGNIFGGAASTAFIPGGAIASQGIKRGIGLAATGAIGAGLQPVEDGEDFAKSKLGQATIGAIGGVALPAVTRAAGKKIDRVANLKFVKAAGRYVGRILGRMPKGTVLDRKGNLTEAGKQALEEAGVKFDTLPEAAKKSLLQQARNPKGLTLDQQIRKADFEALGIPIDKASLTRRFFDQSLESDLSKIPFVGQPILQRRSAQNDAIIEAIETMVPGVNRASKENVGRSLKRAFEERFRQTGHQVNKLYEQAKIARGVDARLDAGSFAQNYASMLRDFPVEEIPSNIRLRISDLNDENFTVGLAEQLRKAVNKRLGSATSKTQAQALKRIHELLDEEVAKVSVGEDAAALMFQDARSLAAQRFREFGFTGKKAGDLRRLVSGGEEAEALTKKFVDNVSMENLVAMKNSLLVGIPNGTLRRMRVEPSIVNSQRQLGLQAWDHMRARVVSNMLRKSVNESRMSEGSVRQIFSGLKFDKAMREIGGEKLNALFTPDEIGTLNTLRRIGLNREFAPGAVNTSGTAKSVDSLTGALRSIATGPRLSVKSRAVREIFRMSVINPITKGRQTSVAQEFLEPEVGGLFTQSPVALDNIHQLILERDEAFRRIIDRLPLPQIGALMGLPGNREAPQSIARDILGFEEQEK